jgi:ribosomal protein S24E
MEIKILNHIKNPLLNREEFSLHVISESNPSFADIKKNFGKNEELSVVKEVRGNFGRKEFNSIVFVYESKEAMDKIEKVPRKMRKQAEEAKKTGENK